MPIGVVILIIGVVLGALFGWLVADNYAVGIAGGVAIAMAYLLVASWMDRREDHA